MKVYVIDDLGTDCCGPALQRVYSAALQCFRRFPHYTARVHHGNSRPDTFNDGRSILAL
jgi:hypothetical protein